jgi:putative membrane protein (TIGR04086 family)
MKDKQWKLRRRRTMKSFSYGVMFGTLAVFALVLAFSFIFSLILRFSSLNEGSLQLTITILSFLSLFIGGFISGSRSGKKGWISGGLTGVTYSLIMMLYQFLAYNSFFQWEQLVYHICFTLTAMMGGVLGVNLTKQGVAQI